MRLDDLVNALARRRRGAWLLCGLAAVLDTVERLMIVPGKRQATPAKHKVTRANFFTIKREQSDLGFTYWVLQGHGIYASFELFDTWAEAMSAAETRLAGESIALAR